MIDDKNPYIEWGLEKTKSVLDRVNNDIVKLSRDINFVDSRISELNERKKQLRNKYSKRVKYKNLIQKQLSNNFWI